MRSLRIVRLGRIFRRRRRAGLLALAAVVVAASSYWYLEAETVGARCGRDAAGAASGYRHEWNWPAFAYECIYTDERGKTISRRFPVRPGLGDFR